MVNPSRLVTLRGLSALYVDQGGASLFPEATLREWANLNKDGFRDTCIVLVVGKVLVDLDAFGRWVEAGRGKVRERRVVDIESAPQKRGTTLRPFAEVWPKSAKRRAG